MDEAAFRKLISGAPGDLRSRCLRGSLRCLSVFYAAGVKARNLAYDFIPGLAQPADVPVVSIGNLTTGGTGKTPVVATTVQCLKRLKRAPGIVSRGYRAGPSGFNDERIVLDQQCPGVPHEQNSSRILAARRLVAAHSVDTIVMDDGLQHRQLRRDLNVVLIDVTCPFGFGFQLPRGLLRESPRGLRRADLVLLTRSNMVSESVRHSIVRTILRYSPALEDKILGTTFDATHLIRPDGSHSSTDELAARSVYLMSGIGNPAAFRATCESLRTIVVGEAIFADHHHYTDAEVRAVVEEAARRGADCVLTTHKDAVKLSSTTDNIWTVGIGCRFNSDNEYQDFETALQTAVSGTDANNTS